MYSKLGSKIVIFSEIILVLLSVFLVMSLPQIKSVPRKLDSICQKLKSFFRASKDLCKDVSISYYVFYSGLLTSFSILFALSFQPLMQGALFPLFLFGIVAFSNHAVRALSGVVAGKLLRNFDINKLVVPLFVLYVLGFVFVFYILASSNVAIILMLLILICLIIGVQVVFTILHVSRIHKFVTIEKRGTLMAVNNFVSRVLAAIVLISSKFFIGKGGLTQFFVIAFVVFLVTGSYFMVKITKLRCKE